MSCITAIGVLKNEGEAMQQQEKTIINLKQSKSGNAVYLWSEKKKGGFAITRVQCSFNEDMCAGLSEAGYIKIDFPIPTADGPVFLWYFCGSTKFDIPIVEIGLSFTPEEDCDMMKQGFDRAFCNLSDEYGTSVFVWVKRDKPTFIYDVTATNDYDGDAKLFEAGYNRIDQPTNTIFCGHKSANFLWYRLTTDAKNALTNLQISTNPDEYQQYTLQRYTFVDANLNQGSGGRAVYLWYKKEEGKNMLPVKSMLLLHHKFVIKICEGFGILTIDKNINEGNCGYRYLSFLKKQ